MTPYAENHSISTTGPPHHLYSLHNSSMGFNADNHMGPGFTLLRGHIKLMAMVPHLPENHTSSPNIRRQVSTSSIPSYFNSAAASASSSKMFPPITPRMMPSISQKYWRPEHYFRQSMFQGKGSSPHEYFLSFFRQRSSNYQFQSASHFPLLPSAALGLSPFHQTPPIAMMPSFESFPESKEQFIEHQQRQQHNVNAPFSHVNSSSIDSQWQQQSNLMAYHQMMNQQSYEKPQMMMQYPYHQLHPREQLYYSSSPPVSNIGMYPYPAYSQHQQLPTPYAVQSLPCFFSEEMGSSRQAYYPCFNNTTGLEGIYPPQQCPSLPMFNRKAKKRTPAAATRKSKKTTRALEDNEVCIVIEEEEEELPSSSSYLSSTEEYEIRRKQCPPSTIPKQEEEKDDIKKEKKGKLDVPPEAMSEGPKTPTEPADDEKDNGDKNNLNLDVETTEDKEDKMDLKSSELNYNKQKGKKNNSPVVVHVHDCFLSDSSEAELDQELVSDMDGLRRSGKKKSGTMLKCHHHRSNGVITEVFSDLDSDLTPEEVRLYTCDYLMEMLSSQDWNNSYTALQIVVRMARHRPQMLLTHLIENGVILWCAFGHISSPKSALCRAAIYAIKELLEKIPGSMDNHLDKITEKLVVKSLAPNGFIRIECEKALMAMVQHGNLVKVLAALESIRKKPQSRAAGLKMAVARMTLQIVQTAGVDLCLMNASYAEKLLPMLFCFMMEPNSGIRTVAKEALGLLMNHLQFEATVMRHVTFDRNVTEVFKKLDKMRGRCNNCNVSKDSHKSHRKSHVHGSSPRLHATTKHAHS